MKGEGVYCSERGWSTCKEDIERCTIQNSVESGPVPSSDCTEEAPILWIQHQEHVQTIQAS